jgi:D-alanyl-D-alanine endopeptidase (penicillin-binding protein 7)
MLKLALATALSMLFVFEPASAATRVKAGAHAHSHTHAHVAGARHGKSRRTNLAREIAAENHDLMIRRVAMVHGRRHIILQRVRRAGPAFEGAGASAGDLAGLNHVHDALDLRSNVAYVQDQNTSEVLFEKNASVALPIASITKLMTGLLVVEAQQDMNEVLTITDADVDHLKFTSSRLPVGTRMTRGNLLHIALMSSENRAASALGHNYPGGITAFVAAMNAKAHELGMNDTRYVDSNGLSSQNVSSARDLAKLVMIAHQEPVLRQYTTDPRYVVEASGRSIEYHNTNHLVAQPDWNIGLQKTGFINEAGRCLVMQALIQGRNVVMVFLDSKGKQSRTADAGRMRHWIEALKPSMPPATATVTAAASGSAVFPVSMPAQVGAVTR